MLTLANSSTEVIMNYNGKESNKEERGELPKS